MRRKSQLYITMTGAHRLGLRCQVENFPYMVQRVYPIFTNTRVCITLLRKLSAQLLIELDYHSTTGQANREGM